MHMKSFQLAPDTDMPDSSTFRWRASTVALLLAVVMMSAGLLISNAGRDGNILEFVANIFAIPCAAGRAAIMSGYNFAKRRTVQNWVEFATSALLIVFLLFPLIAAYRS